MMYAFPGAGALDYLPCHYGTSRLLFRGPRRDVTGGFVACLGGTETYGKFIPTPFPALLERALDMPVANLGCVNAGPDVYLQDHEVMSIASRAQVCIVQIVGAQNLSNRYYSVHPRRNDRFLGATPLLRSIFRSVDFTEFNFTRHMLGALQRQSADRFEVLADELRSAWVSRMKDLLSHIHCPTVLLWLAEAPPPGPGRRADMEQEPLMIDSAMIGALRALATSYVEVTPSAEARAKGADGMAFGALEAPAAAGLPGPVAHEELAKRLMPVLRQLL
jgi:hypothetical protein